MLDVQTLAKRTIHRASHRIVIEVDPAVDSDPVEWIQNSFYIPETGGPIELYPSQSLPLREALRRDDDGKFVYSTVLWGAIKKSAKSSIAAAVGMWFAWRKPLSSVKVLGNDLDQAQSRVFEYMRRAVLLRPEWKASIQVTTNKITLPNGSVIKAIPIDPTGEAGSNDDLVLYTELWGWKSKKHQLMWTESTLSPTKYGESLRWCETYAGYNGESPVLYPLYERGVSVGRVIDTELEMYANDAARLFALWTTRPSLPWQTPEYYAQEEATLAPSEVQRVHHNQWQSATEAFIPIEWWDGCQGELAPLRRNQELVLAADAGISSDNFGLVGVTRTGDMTEPRYVRKWVPPPGGKIIFSNPDDPNDPQYPEGEIRRLARTYNVVKLVADPTQLHDLLTRLRRSGLIAVEEFNQGERRLVADKHLYDIIRERRVRWDTRTPNITDLREHIENANRTLDKEGEHRMRIVKREAVKKIDLAVTLSMAAEEAKRLNLG